jgi:hypothetical protein
MKDAKKIGMILALAGAFALAVSGCGTMSGDSVVLDKVYIGNQVSENAHMMKVENSETGVNIENWRHAIDAGWFQYSMKTGGNENLAVRVRYWAYEAGERTFNIIVEDQVIATENVVGKFKDEQAPKDFYDIDYPVPAELARGKESILVKFQGADEYQIAGGVYGLSLVNLGSLN